MPRPSLDGGSPLWKALADSRALAVLLRGGQPFLVSRGLSAIVGADAAASAAVARLFIAVAWQERAAGVVEGILVDREGNERQLHFDLSWPESGTDLVLAVGTDRTEQRAREAELERRALTDALTGLPNRVLFDDRLEQALLAGGRAGETVGLVVFDLDRFKDVNDTLGHRAGDDLLRLVAERVRSHLRDSDTVARLGGDEFAILLRPPMDATKAVTASEKVARALAETFAVASSTIQLSASFGVALFPDHGTSPSVLLDRADAAMFAAKRRGARVSLYDGDRDTDGPDGTSQVGRLREAIRSDGLALQFQPTVRLHDRRSIRHEALVRWPQAVGGGLRPKAFVPLAERNGLGAALSSWVLGRALRRYREWQLVGIDDGISVNVSLQDLMDRGFPARVRGELSAQDVEPSALTLEVSARSLDTVRVSRIERPLADLSEEGVRFALDDFGAGETALAHLLRLPFAELKVDRSVISRLCTEAQSWRFVRQAIDGAHDRGLETTAEGVEDETTAHVLERLGCDVAQGRYLTHSLVGDREAFLRSGELESATLS